MATHQELGGISDEDLVNRMIATHDDRFDEAFWDYFSDQVVPHLPSHPSMVDIGCGPGLLLRDLRDRIEGASLRGFDLTQAMIDYAEQKVTYAGVPPRYQQLDFSQEPVPIADGSVDMLSMVAVLHVLNDPLAACAEVCRLLADDGIFLLQDWIRTPLPEYLDRMVNPELPTVKAQEMRRAILRLFPVHNKFTVDDWLWVLNNSGLRVLYHRQLRSPHFRTFVCQKI